MNLVNDPEYALFKMHQAQRQAAQRRRFRFSRANSLDPRKELAGLAETMALRKLVGMGFSVHRNGYNDPYDLMCEGLRIEVKGASWSSDRYQFRIRNHEADLFLLACQMTDDALGWFVIPAEACADVNSVSIWSPDPNDYAGKWAEYLEAWWWVDALLQQVGDGRSWQPVLIKGGVM